MSSYSTKQCPLLPFSSIVNGLQQSKSTKQSMRVNFNPLQSLYKNKNKVGKYNIENQPPQASSAQPPLPINLYKKYKSTRKFNKM